MEIYLMKIESSESKTHTHTNNKQESGDDWKLFIKIQLKFTKLKKGFKNDGKFVYLL